MILRRATPAPDPAFALADLKHNCRVESGDHDAFIAQLGEAAATYIERITGHFFGGGTVTADFPGLPLRIVLPARFGAVDTVTYRDEDHGLVTMPPQDYAYDGTLLRVLAAPLPRVATRADAVTVTLAVAAPWPRHLAQAGAMLVAHWWDARTTVRLGADGVIGGGELPLAFTALASSESVTGL